MTFHKLKTAFLAATTIAVALSVGFAAPASAIPNVTITSSAPTISRGETIAISTDGDTLLGAVFVNGEYLGVSPGGLLEDDAAPWETFSPCVTVDVTFRMYREVFDENTVKSYNDAFADEVTIEWIGDNTVDCNPEWGAGVTAGTDEPLAKTGSDASTVAGMTGIAGVTALAVALAVARRQRRVQR